MSWLSDLIHKVTTTDAVDFVRTGPLPIGNQPPAATALQPGEGYLSVRVASLRLPNTRQKVFEKLYGIVHAFADLPSAAGSHIQFAAATMPSKLAGVDPVNLQNVLIINKLVVGPTPWSGGDLNLQIGLFSVVSENLAGPFLDTMTKLSDTVGVAFAVEALTRATGSVKLEIGLDETFSPPTTGNFAIVAEAVAKLAGKTLSLDPADKKLLVNGVHYTDKPYLIFFIESSQERSDWGEIPELKTAYGAIRDAVVGNDQGKAKSTLEAFERLANFSPDLTANDAARLIRKVRDLVAGAFKVAANASEMMQLPEFHEVGLYAAM
jgi:hypothetical protein